MGCLLPFHLRKMNISLKVRNFNSSLLKVNDSDGNPIEISAVIVFRVVDTAKALFNVDYYQDFVEIQSETAIRHVATQYPYDTFSDNDVTLRETNFRGVNQRIARTLSSGWCRGYRNTVESFSLCN